MKLRKSKEENIEVSWSLIAMAVVLAAALGYGFESKMASARAGQKAAEGAAFAMSSRAGAMAAVAKAAKELAAAPCSGAAPSFRSAAELDAISSSMAGSWGLDGVAWSPSYPGPLGLRDSEQTNGESFVLELPAGISGCARLWFKGSYSKGVLADGLAARGAVASRAMEPAGFKWFARSGLQEMDGGLQIRSVSVFDGFWLMASIAIAGSMAIAAIGYRVRRLDRSKKEAADLLMALDSSAYVGAELPFDVDGEAAKAAASIASKLAAARKGKDLAEALYEAAESAMDEGLFVIDESMRIKRANSKHMGTLGQMKTIDQMASDPSRPDLQAALAESFASKCNLIWNGWGADSRMISLRGSPAIGTDLWVFRLRDASEAAKLRERMEMDRRKSEKAMEAVNEAMLFLDAYGHVEKASAGALEMLGKSLAQVRGLWAGRVLELSDREDASEAPLEEVLLHERLDSDRWMLAAAQGRSIPVELSWRKLGANSFEGVVSMRDISERVKELEQIKWESRHDSLTGLANRRQFAFALEESLGKGDGSKKSIFMVDLDGFKQVNDQHGHDVGDEVLRSVASAIKNAIGPFDMAARLGGDEFAILAEADASRQQSLAAELRAAVVGARVALRGGGSVGVDASVGYCEIDDSGQEPGSPWEASHAMKKADLMMYGIKEARKKQASARSVP